MTPAGESYGRTYSQVSDLYRSLLISVKWTEQADLYTGALKMRNCIIIIIVKTLQFGHATKVI